MARLSATSPLQGLSGHIGKEIVFKQYGAATIVSKLPDMSRVQPSALQQEQRRLFKEAMAFAKLVKSHAALRALYQTDLQPGDTVFHKAKREYLMRLSPQ